jgi:hypothetical protein
MSDTSSGSPRSRAKSSAKRGAKASAKKNAGPRDVLAGEGVLANLPRTRPQRSSARRDAARRSAGSAAATAGTPPRSPRPAATKQAPAKARPGPAAKPKAAPRATAKVRSKTAAARAQDSVPRQGFETEGDPVSGPVQPPGGVDLLSSAAELAGELTKSGLSSGGRLLKDFLTRLPLN